MKSLLSLGILVLAFAISGCASKGSSKGFGDGDVSATGESTTGGIGLGTLARVHFDYNRSTLGEAAKTILKKNAEVMKKTGKMRVLVEGHCDERGTNEYNIALGERRAKAALDYLVSLGIARSRLEMKSWGEERPLDAGHDEQAWGKNRRGEFVILAK